MLFAIHTFTHNNDWSCIEIMIIFKAKLGRILLAKDNLFPRNNIINKLLLFPITIIFYVHIEVRFGTIQSSWFDVDFEGSCIL